MLKSLLYRLLKRLVGICFNILNILLAGNLPPLGCVCIVAVDQDKILAVERPEGGCVFPGGFMRWREHPLQTAERECIEETGLRPRVTGLVGCSSNITDSFSRMSTLTVIYHAEVIDGEMKSSIEGHPRWLDVDELQKRLQHKQTGILEHYLRYRDQGKPT